jgi:hypothetical protein
MRIIAASTGLTAIALAALVGASAGFAPGTPATATAPAWVDPPARAAAAAVVVPPVPSAVAVLASVPAAGIPQASAAAVPLRVSVKPRAPHRRTVRRAAPKPASTRVQVATLVPPPAVPAEARKPRPSTSPLAFGPVGDILRGVGAID